MLQIARDKGNYPSQHRYVIGENLINTSIDKKTLFWSPKDDGLSWVTWCVRLAPRNRQVVGLLKPGEGPVELFLTLKGGVIEVLNRHKKGAAK